MFVIIIVGFLLYSDVLSFDGDDVFSGLEKTSEKTREIVQTIKQNSERIISYSIHDVPNLPDSQIPINALKKALYSWESINPNLTFVEAENPEIVFRWQVYASETHTGLATCNSALFGVLNSCILDISVGNEDCNGNYVQNDENMVANIIMHEVGHALGLRHTMEKNNLMYSNEFPEENFDTLGLQIPQKFDELYIGQKELLDQDRQIRNNIESFDEEISKLQIQYDEYFEQYLFYEGKSLSDEELEKTKRIFDKLSSISDEINTSIDERNMLVYQSNELLEQLGCQPNFVIVE